jgi:fatty acid desaturase
MNTMTNTLFEELRADLPKEAFQRNPRQALFVLPILAIILTGSWFLLRERPPWFLSLPVSLLIGLAYSSFGFLGHEVLHGAVFRSRFPENLIGYPALCILGFSPTLWRVWHNQTHHAHPNMAGEDPDCYGTLEQFRGVPASRMKFQYGVISAFLTSHHLLFFGLTAHAQNILWNEGRKGSLRFSPAALRRARIESLVLIGLWVIFGFIIGLTSTLYVILIPMAVANSILMSYIVTNHLLRPLADADEPVDHSMSLSTPKWLDRIHFCFSHHVEHHYFPGMSSKFLPLVRKSLLKRVPDRYLAPPHWKALLWLTRTPRFYGDQKTLVDPCSGRSLRVTEIEAHLKGAPREITLA